MKAKLKANEAFGVILQKTKIPPMNGEPHAERLDRFAYTVTRDALHLYGCDFKDAEWMASHSKGPAKKRFDKCIRDLGK